MYNFQSRHTTPLQTQIIHTTTADKNNHYCDLFKTQNIVTNILVLKNKFYQLDFQLKL